MPNDLQHEIKKREPFARPEEEAVLNLLKTSDLLQNRIGRLFRQHGLTSSQYNVLRILRGEGKPLPCLEIASRLIQVVPAITGLIDRLEKQGLVTRERSASDRRVIHIAITAHGKALVDRLDDPLAELDQRIFADFSARELKQFSRLLVKVRQQIPE